MSQNGLTLRMIFFVDNSNGYFFLVCYRNILHIFGCMQDSYVRQKDDFVVFVGLRRCV